MQKRQLFQLALSSFLVLFLELLIIRLLSTEIRIFAYLSNLVLLAIFVGSSVGMLIKRKFPISLSAILVFSFCAILSMQYIVRFPNLEFRLFSGITELLAPLSESYIWLQIDTFSKTGIAIGIVLTFLLTALVGMIFVPIGQKLGELFGTKGHPMLIYSINIASSIAGMWVFQLLSLANISPYFGLFLASILLLLLIEKSNDRIITIASIIGITILLLPHNPYQPYERPATFWTPYQKLTLSVIQRDKLYQPEGWYLEVNNVGYMGLLDLSQKSLDLRMPEIMKHTKNLSDTLLSNQYTLPYAISPKHDTALIIGGGGGNDAAGALRSNVKDVDVVEIDPMIITIGKKYHPEKPYNNRRVKTYVNDGRSFLETTSKKYDVIVMSLADSHTTSSSLTNLQLDNYLYTSQAFSSVKSHLNDNGLFFLTFEVNRPWIGERFTKTLKGTFGNTPAIVNVRSDGIFGWGGIMFIAGKNESTIKTVTAENKTIAEYLARHKMEYKDSSVNTLTDNWPYVYLDKPRLPFLHLIVSLSALTVLLLLTSRILPRKSINWPFFFLGAGFLLFEFQNISRSSLIFGNTWQTNLFIITGVLVFILVANLSVYKKLIPLKLAFVLLYATFLLQIIVPISYFNTLSGAAKIPVALLFLTLPHFFSGIIFATLFTRQKDKARAIGSNLLGSAIGGIFAIVSYLLGIHSLLYFTILFYSLYFIFK